MQIGIDKYKYNINIIVYIYIFIAFMSYHILLYSKWERQSCESTGKTLISPRPLLMFKLLLHLEGGHTMQTALPNTSPVLIGPKLFESTEWYTLSPSTQRWFLGTRQVSFGYGDLVRTWSNCMPLTRLQ